MNEWAALDQRVKELHAENERLNAILNGEPELIRMNFTPESGLRVDIKHWAVKLIAANVLETLKELGGENFVVIDLMPTDGRPKLEVTVRLAGKKTTADVIGELRKENAELKDGIDSSHCWLDEWSDYCAHKRDAESLSLRVESLVKEAKERQHEPRI